MKACATCKHQGFNIIVAIFMDAGSQRCLRPNARIDPVTGRLDHTACFIERQFDHLCGRAGRFHSDHEKEQNANR